MNLTDRKVKKRITEKKSYNINIIYEVVQNTIFDTTLTFS